MEEYIDDYTKSWQKVSPLLFNLSLEGAVVLFGVTRILCRKLWDRSCFSKFQRSYETSFKKMRHNKNLQVKVQAVAHTVEQFVILKERILNYIQKDRQPWRNDSIQYQLFTIATDLCLEYISECNPQKITKLFEGISKHTHGVGSNCELESYAFIFYQRAREEYEENNREIDEARWPYDEWIDEEDDHWRPLNVHIGYSSNQEWDEDEDDEESELEEEDENRPESEYDKKKAEIEELIDKCVASFSELLNLFNDKRDIALHAIELQAMRCTVHPRIYNKYRKAVVNLISTYKEGGDSEAIAKARKEADEILIRKHRLTNTYMDFNVRNGRIDEFYLNTEATTKVLWAVNQIPQEEVDKIVDDLTFNKVTKDYSSEAIEDFAKDCIAKARKEILEDN